MGDSRVREQLFAVPSVAAAYAQLTKAVKAATGTSSIGARQIILAHVRDEAEPRHPVTRWG